MNTKSAKPFLVSYEFISLFYLSQTENTQTSEKRLTFSFYMILGLSPKTKSKQEALNPVLV